MGWSYGVRAGYTLDAWMKACVEQTGMQNVFEANGNKYFYEHTRRNHSDGAITGAIWRYLPNNQVRRSGGFRINGDGTVERAPKWLKDVSPSPEKLDERYKDYSNTFSSVEEVLEYNRKLLQEN